MEMFIRCAISFAARPSARRDHQVTIAVGVRAASGLEAAGRPVEQVVGVPASIGGIGAAVEQVLRKVEDWHSTRGIETIVLFCARPVSGASASSRRVRQESITSELLDIIASFEALRIAPRKPHLR